MKTRTELRYLLVNASSSYAIHISNVETYISDHFAYRVPLLRLNVRKELALHLGVAPSQISRILNGDTKSINSDLLIKLAREFHVSTDYILGLHKEPQDTGYLPMLLMSTAFRA